MAKQKLIPYVHVDGKTWDYYFVDPASRKPEEHLGGWIYFSKRHNGKKIKFSTKTREPHGLQAKRYANSEFDRRIGKKATVVHNTIGEELEAFEKFKESEGWKQDTMNNIYRAIRQMKEFWSARFPDDITRDSFAEWCSWWKKHHADIEMENAIKYFNNFCVYLHEKVVNGSPLLPSVLRFQDPNRKKIRARRERKKERIFTAEEFAHVRDKGLTLEEKTVVSTMYTMATRIDETLKLDTTRILLDLEMPKYRWTVDSNKAERIGEHFLHPSLIEDYRELRERRRAEKTKLFFPQVLNNQQPLREQQIDWDAWRTRANLDFHWTPHTFRHTILTNLFNDPRWAFAVVCKLYRVSPEVAIRVYVKVRPDSMLIMRDAIEVPK